MHLLLAAAAAAVVCIAWITTSARNPTTAAKAELQPCRIPGVRNEVRCGWLSRPLNPARPDARHITVRYVVVPALAQRPAPDPVFLLAGGPGQSAVAIAGAVMPLFDRLNNRHDVVFVDQRGTGGSMPLACEPDGADAPVGTTAFARQADPAVQAAVLQHCMAWLEALPALHNAAEPGEPLQYFTTPIAVQDLDAVRAAIGADRIDLVGISYGTRVGLEYLRQFPQHARRLVLDGVAPADMALPRSMSADNQQALDAVFAACRTEPACARDHPNLRARWQALLAALPQTASYTDPLTGAEQRTTLRRETVLAAVRNPLYLPARAAALPAAIDAATHGRWNALVGLSGLVAPRRDTDPVMGMHLGVVCSEDMAALLRPMQNRAPGLGSLSSDSGQSPDRPGVDFGTESVDAYRRLCAQWPRGRLPPDYGRLSTSPVPVLLLSGGLDPATPPRHAAKVAAALGANARSVVVANAGHNVLALPCMADVLFRFIDAPDDKTALATDTNCAAGVPRPAAFALPGAGL